MYKPVDFQLVGESTSSFGMVIQSSRTGLVLQCLKDMPVGTRVIIGVESPEGFESCQGRAVCEIVRKDMCLWDDWEGYQYGLKYIRRSNKLP